jgi:hypothetical protein
LVPSLENLLEQGCIISCDSFKALKEKLKFFDEFFLIQQLQVLVHLCGGRYLRLLKLYQAELNEVVE